MNYLKKIEALQKIHTETADSQKDMERSLSEVSDKITDMEEWEALKAYVSGQIILWKSLKNKQFRANETELNRKFKEIDRKHASVTSEDLHKEKLALKTELDLLYTTRTVKTLTRTKYTFYEQGERRSRLLEDTGHI